MKWGIDVPNDPDSVMYVWFEALINYLTISKRLGIIKEDKKGNLVSEKNFNMINVIGKDILKFHGVLWPQMLDKSSLSFNQTILCHEHWKYEDVTNFI